MKIDVSEIAGELLETIINKLKDINGKEFTNECLDILTLCCSEMIKAGYCKSHYDEALNKIINQIKEDLQND